LTDQDILEAFKGHEALTNNEFVSVKEADLSGHLRNGKEKAKDEAELANKDKNIVDINDYALTEALNLLKGISILKK
jgi:carboxyl-terminal processing protease